MVHPPLFILLWGRGGGRCSLPPPPQIQGAKALAVAFARVLFSSGSVARPARGPAALGAPPLPTYHASL